MSDEREGVGRERSEADGDRPGAQRLRRARRSAAALGRRIREADRRPAAVNAIRSLRRLAPGGGRLPDAVPTRASDRLARLIAEVGADQPSATRELGLAAIQLWQAVAGPAALAHPDGEISIVFTDLVEFSEWALRAGDDQVLRLLHKVGEVSEAAIARHGGRVVKSLGDGLMAVFADPAAAIEASHAMCAAVSAIDLDGYRPRLRAGVHLGRPRKVGRDFLGVDVNVAARVADAASAGEVLVSGPALARVEPDRYTVRRRRRFRAKGTPDDLDVFAVLPRRGSS